MAQRPHYCLLTATAALEFVRVYGGGGFSERFIPRRILTPSGRPFNSSRDKNFIIEQLDKNNVPYVMAPATDYVNAETDLASGGIFREQQNTPQERDSVVWW